MGKNNLFLISIRIVAIIMLIWALTPNPYGYYIILRWIVFFISIYCAYKAYTIKNEIWIWIYGLMAGVYNPIISLHLGKSIWQITNVITAIVIMISLFSLKLKNKNCL